VGPDFGFGGWVLLEVRPTFAKPRDQNAQNADKVAIPLRSVTSRSGLNLVSTLAGAIARRV